jgi:tripeptidyl-peptidase-1
LFAPSDAAVQSVRAWLEASGIDANRISQSVNRQWIQFDAKVHEVEDLLKTEYHSWQHKVSGVVSPACTEYHVPAHVQEHIDYVTPGLRLMAGGKVSTGKEKNEKRGFRIKNEKFSGPVMGIVKHPILEVECRLG